MSIEILIREINEIVKNDIVEKTCQFFRQDVDIMVESKIEELRRAGEVLKDEIDQYEIQCKPMSIDCIDVCVAANDVNPINALKRLKNRIASSQFGNKRIRLIPNEQVIKSDILASIEYGNTAIALHPEKVVVELKCNNMRNIECFMALANGNFVVCTSGGTIHLCDANGQEIKSYDVEDKHSTVNMVQSCGNIVAYNHDSIIILSGTDLELLHCSINMKKFVLCVYANDEAIYCLGTTSYEGKELRDAREFSAWEYNWRSLHQIWKYDVNLVLIKVVGQKSDLKPWFLQTPLVYDVGDNDADIDDEDLESTQIVNFCCDKTEGIILCYAERFIRMDADGHEKCNGAFNGQRDMSFGTEHVYSIVDQKFVTFDFNFIMICQDVHHFVRPLLEHGSRKIPLVLDLSTQTIYNIAS